MRAMERGRPSTYSHQWRLRVNNETPMGELHITHPDGSHCVWLRPNECPPWWGVRGMNRLHQRVLRWFDEPKFHSLDELWTNIDQVKFKQQLEGQDGADRKRALLEMARENSEAARDVMSADEYEWCLVAIDALDKTRRLYSSQFEEWFFPEPQPACIKWHNCKVVL